MATTGSVTIEGKSYNFTRPRDRKNLDFLIRKNLGYMRLVQGDVVLTPAQESEAEDALNKVLFMMLPSAPAAEIAGIKYFARLDIFISAMEWLR